jgi:hypothetical protein
LRFRKHVEPAVPPGGRAPMFRRVIFAMLVGGAVALVGGLSLLVCGVRDGILEPAPAALGAIAGYGVTVWRYRRR